MSAWDSFRFPSDGPYPAGTVRVAGVRLPMRVFIVRGVVIPVPWEPQTEQAFQRWFRAFALSKGWSTNPDHDRYEVDWRAAWWCGFRQIADESLKTISGKVPAEKLQTFERTENKNRVIVARR